MRTHQGEAITTETSIRIQGAGLHGTLRLRLVDDGLAHVLEHAQTDETSGTWTGLACPDHGHPIGADVAIAVLTAMCADREIADLLWEAPAGLTGPHNEVFQRAMQAFQAGDIQLAEQHWRELAAIWSHAWAANYDVLAYMQEVGLDRFGSDPPQRWVIASFEHHASPHGVNAPHVHNVVIPPRIESS